MCFYDLDQKSRCRQARVRHDRRWGEGAFTFDIAPVTKKILQELLVDEDEFDARIIRPASGFHLRGVPGGEPVEFALDGGNE